MLGIVYETLWEILVLVTDHECQRCNSLDGMFALFDSQRNEVILECRICYDVQTLNGKAITSISPDKIRLAKNDELKRAGLIK